MSVDVGTRMGDLDDLDAILAGDRDDLERTFSGSAFDFLDQIPLQDLPLLGNRP